jgi:uncharacterized iron-regulated protein
MYIGLSRAAKCRFLSIFLCSLLLAMLPQQAAMAQQPASPAPLSPGLGWKSPFGKNHPLAGRIWSTSARTYVSPAALISALRQARFVLLGENHENEDHHRLQAWIVAALIDEGRRPALGFEMLDTDQEKLLSGYLAEHPVMQEVSAPLWAGRKWAGRHGSTTSRSLRQP